ncbi:phage/plasmid primase, P4 family [Tsukamurella pulmonis]|uniref:phage/plasmid primase, P4 family n=1 Tax=Tsukamurella pulmonis TaxID=47312 RepID=UPI000E094322|nr:phage/plasmid primase, P4 family [Tsukamurella pulmonis]RDH13403.1 hypothetical protein DVB88_02610 [Tsukamurella pulmonis]
MSHDEKSPTAASDEASSELFWAANNEKPSSESITRALDTATIYGDHAGKYLRAGWMSPLPLPEGLKATPPDDTTGNKPYITHDDIEIWCENQPEANLGLRMGLVKINDVSYEVIGLDVDHYDAKLGADTLATLVEHHGALPKTYRSTSRDPENPSGIRFFLVPAGRKWVGKPGPDIEVIQRTHRYAVAWPSVVTWDKGPVDPPRMYRWYDPEGDPMDEPPLVADLPLLPEEWQRFLYKGEVSGEGRVIAEITDVELAEAWLAENIPGYEEQPSGQMNRATDVGKLEDEMVVGAHDMMVTRMHEVVQLAAEGHHGLKIGMSRVRKAFFEETLGAKDGEARRDLTSAKLEWRRALCGEVSKLRADIADGLIIISTVGGYTAADGEIDLAVFREKTLAQVLRSIRTVDATEFENSDTGHARMFLACMGDLVQAIDGGEWALWDQVVGRLSQVKAPELSGRAWEASVKASITETAKTVRAAALNVADDEDRATMEKLADDLDRRDTACGNRRVIDPSIDMAHRFSRKIDPQTLDADRLTMGMPDGVLDLRNPGDPMRRGRPEDLILMQAGTTYDRDAASPLFDAYLDTFVPDLELRRYVQKVLGYAAITGGNPLRVMVWLKGGTSTGKTTMIEAMQAALGDYGGTVDVNALLRQKRDGGPMPEVLAAMMRRAVFASEVGHHNRLHSDVIKRLTGGDTVTARALYSNVMVQRTPMFTPVIATNDAPTIEDADAALARRLIVLPFEQSVPPPANQENEPPALKDDPEAVRALFAWLVEGALMARREGLHNDMPTAVVDARREFLASVNPFREWCDRTFDEAPAGTPLGEQANTSTAWQAWSTAVCTDPELKKLAPTRKAFSTLMQGVYGPVGKSSRKVPVDDAMKDRYFYKTPIVLRTSTENDMP